MKTLVETIVKSIVDNEKEVRVTEIPGQNSVILEIRVAKEDLGKIIGKQGKNAISIRNIIFAASFKTKKRYTVDINSTGGDGIIKKDRPVQDDQREYTKSDYTYDKNYNNKY